MFELTKEEFKSLDAKVHHKRVTKIVPGDVVMMSRYVYIFAMIISNEVIDFVIATTTMTTTTIIKGRKLTWIVSGIISSNLFFEDNYELLTLRYQSNRKKK
jgi:hypothetical protein